jgi:hypothetical protein
MNTASFALRKFLIVFGTAFSLLAFASAARAQANSPGTLNLKTTAADSSAAAGAKTGYHHSLPANTPAGKTLRGREAVVGLNGRSGENGEGHDGGIVSYPGDLTYLGGAVVPFIKFHAVYMLPNGTCPIATCWGDPEGFLDRLGRSDFIHLLDQYVGLSGGDRYKVGFDANVPYTPPTPSAANPLGALTDADIVAVVHLVASASGDTGYGHEYHVFLPPGQDQCFTAAETQCYSPDNPSTFFYCGYHGSVDFQDIGHVLYSVEPYENVLGCSVYPNSPSGQLVDSQDNVLSHESFETITDPDGTAWINFSQVIMLGAEIGDECEFVTFLGPNQTPYFNPPAFKIDGHKYAVQSEYSNDVHGCGTAP